MTKSTETIINALKETVLNAPGRMTVDALVRSVCAQSGVVRRQVREALRVLVAAGDLVYTYELGSSFVVPSVDRPVRVSDRLVLVPDNRTYGPAPGERVVRLARGAAFGSGDHVTTRLALAGLDLAMQDRGPAGSDSDERQVLDIGTGSGVLVIAAVRLGADRGIGTDIDPCALAEAKANVAANGFCGRIAVADRNLETMEGRFALVLANLRLPTLIGLTPDLVRLVAPGGDIVISGIRQEEAPILIRNYAEAGFCLRWQDAAGGWAGIWFRRHGPLRS